MIKNLDVRLYKKTAIYSDGKEVDFPFMKAILLMIILSDKKIHSKKKLQLMLWFDKNEQKADRNLRNTIYVIKQKLGSDVIITEKNSMIRLNENIKVSNDLDIISDIDYEDMDLYDLETLKELIVNDSNLVDIKLEPKAEFTKLELNMNSLQNITIPDNTNIDNANMFFQKFKMTIKVNSEQEIPFKLSLRPDSGITNKGAETLSKSNSFDR